MSCRGLHLTVGLALVLAACSDKKRGSPGEVNVSYGTLRNGGQALMDVYRPPESAIGASSSARPAVVVIHGGYWQAGGPKDVAKPAAALAERGFVAFAPNYSLAPGTRWPGQLEDLRMLLRFLRANAARFAIDPDRVATYGLSAGGMLASMLALRDDPAATNAPRGGRALAAVHVFAVGDLEGIVDGLLPDEDRHLTALLGAPRAQLTAEQLRDASPAHFARPDASVLIVQGTDDDVVLIAHAEAYDRALTAAGADHESVVVPGGRHDESTYFAPGVFERSAAFLSDRAARPSGPRAP